MSVYFKEFYLIYFDNNYQAEWMYPDSGWTPPVYGPDVNILNAFSWKIRFLPKIKHFIWQIVSGYIAVKTNLCAKGIQCDT